MIIHFSKKEFLHLGVSLGSSWGIDQIDRMTEKRRRRYFNDSFFADAKTVKEIFRDIQHPDMGDKRIANPSPVDLLAALYFLKKYPTKFTLAKYMGCSERHALDKAW